MDKATVLAKALELLGKGVVVHWEDEDGNICAVIGMLKRVTGQRLWIDDPHAEPLIERVLEINAA